MLSDRGEEILESLWGILIEGKKESCDAGILKDDTALRELLEAGYIKLEESKVALTSKGKEESKNCVRRHRLAERLFVDILDIKKKLVHETSCRFEHLLHKGLDENVCTLLGHPRTCPHGRHIPEGECCRAARKIAGRLIMPLPELEVNKNAKISHLETKDPTALQKIISIGALPNADIKLIQKFPSYVFQLGKSQFAIDKDLASCIYVRAT